MMLEKEFDLVYGKIAKCTKKFVGKKEGDVYLWIESEFDEMVGGKVYINDNKEYKRYCNDMEEVDDKYWQFLDSLSGLVLKLKKLYNEREGHSFTNVKIHYSPDWEVLSVSYGVETYSDYNKKLLDEIVWEYKTLNIYPVNKGEIDMLEKFLEGEKHE